MVIYHTRVLFNFLKYLNLNLLNDMIIAMFQMYMQTLNILFFSGEGTTTAPETEAPMESENTTQVKFYINDDLIYLFTAVLHYCVLFLLHPSVKRK